MAVSEIEHLLMQASQDGFSTEIFQVVTQTTSVQFANNRLKSLRKGHSDVVAIRVIKDGLLGFASGQGTSSEEVYEKALYASQWGPKATFSFAGPQAQNQVELPTNTTDANTLVLQGEAMLAGLSDVDARFQASASGVILEEEVRIASTEGLQDSYRKSVVHQSLGGRLVQDGDFHAISTGSYVDKEPVHEHMLAEAREKFAWGQNVVRVAPGRYRTLFTPRTFQALLPALLARLDGQNMHQSLSQWADKEGQQVLSKQFSLYNDATFGVGAVAFDDEGVQQKVTPMIEAGVLTGVVADLRTAQLLGIAPVGLGVRGELERPPSAGMLSAVVAPGEVEQKQLLATLGTGLLIDGLIGARITNPLLGDMSGNVSSGYWVENGEVVGRLKNAVISLNVFTALGEQLLALGNESTWVQGRGRPAYVPYVLLDAIDLAARNA